MFWYRELYLGVTVKKKAKQIKRKINGNKFNPCTYLIILPRDGSAVLELLPVFTMRYPGFEDSGLRVVGIAGNKKEAMELTRCIIQDVFSQRNDFNVRSFMERRE